MADPYADVDVVINDSSGRKPCRICHIHAILYDSCHLYGVADAATDHAFVRSRDRNQDKCVVSVLVLYLPAATFASRRAYD